MSGKVYVVASGKGGVGKTTTTLNLGATLGRAGGSVVLLDSDMGMANLAAVLGIDHSPTLHDVLADEASLEDALVSEMPDFTVVPGGRSLDAYAAADPANLWGVIESLRGRYEYVIVDAGAGLAYDDVLPLSLADEVILVTTPSEVAIIDTEKMTDLVGMLDRDTAGVVVNRVRSDRDFEHVTERFDGELLGVIPEDEAIRESNIAGEPVERHDAESPGAAAFRRLGKAITGEEVGEPTDPPVEGDSTSGGVVQKERGERRRIRQVVEHIRDILTHRT